MGKDRSQFNYGLPGGRAYYRGKDAYASQSRENESRIDQQPGYVKAVLQADTTYPVALNTIKWTTTTLSNFIRALEKYGWGYTESTGVFTCMRGGRYIIGLTASINNSTGTDDFGLQVRIVRNINNVAHTYIINSDISATELARADIVLYSEFDFLVGDQVSAEFDNTGAGGSRTLTGLAGAGTTTETQNMGEFCLRQID